MPKERVLTPESFEQLLSWLDPDRDKAGEKYEAVRHRLVTFFTARRCLEADVLADLTITIVADKLSGLASHYEGDPVRYFYGVAKNVIPDYLRNEQRKKRRPPPLSGRSEKALACLEECMEKLSPHVRDTFEEYYCGGESGQTNLAERLGCSTNALRLRVHRVRAELRDCVKHCLERRAE